MWTQPRFRVGVVALVLVAGAACLVLMGRRKGAVLPGTVLCSARVPGYVVVELREADYPPHVKLWLYTCRWVPPGGKPRDYLVFTSSTRWRRVEIRWDEEHRNVFVVVGGSHVAASLAVDTGRFIGENGLVMDPAVPLERQERAGISGGQPGHPAWARPGRGVLLASCAP